MFGKPIVKHGERSLFRVHILDKTVLPLTSLRDESELEHLIRHEVDFGARMKFNTRVIWRNDKGFVIVHT